MKKKYWSNVCAMLGVALIATSFFQEHWFCGTMLGAYSLYLGARWWEACMYYITIFIGLTALAFAVDRGWI